jgi:hypothetical protein
MQHGQEQWVAADTGPRLKLYSATLVSTCFGCTPGQWKSGLMGWSIDGFSEGSSHS